MASSRRQRQLHRLGWELLENEDPEAQMLVGLQSLAMLLSADLAAEYVVDVGRGTSHVVEVPEVLLPVMVEDENVMLSSPGVPYMANNRHLPPSRAEDLCSPRAWVENPLRRRVLEPAGVPHSVISAHRTPAGVIQGWGVNRGGRFTDGEIDTFHQFEPFLRRAARDRARQRLVLDLDRAVATGQGLVIFRGRLLAYANTQAEEILEEHHLQVEAVLRVAESAPIMTHGEAVVRTPAGLLRFRRRPALVGSLAVVLAAVDGGAEGAPRISAREHVVLSHLSDGLSAAAIARRLNISERTVHKHLENLYRALGVRDRLNAVLRGRAAGLLPLVDPATVPRVRQGAGTPRR